MRRVRFAWTFAAAVMAIVPLVLGAQTPSVQVEKRGPDTVNFGQPLVYEILVRNVGPAPVYDVRVVDELPGGVRYLLTFRPFSRLPAAIQKAYLGGDLVLLPSPATLVFCGAKAAGTSTHVRGTCWAGSVCAGRCCAGNPNEGSPGMVTPGK